MEVNSSPPKEALADSIAERLRNVQKRLSKARPLVQQVEKGELKVLSDAQKRLVEQYPGLLWELSELRSGRLPQPVATAATATCSGVAGEHAEAAAEVPACAETVAEESGEAAEERSGVPPTAKDLGGDESESLHGTCSSSSRQGSLPTADPVTVEQREELLLQEMIPMSERQRHAMLEQYIARQERELGLKLRQLTKAYDAACDLRRRIVSGAIAKPSKVQLARLEGLEDARKELQRESAHVRRAQAALRCNITERFEQWLEEEDARAEAEAKATIEAAAAAEREREREEAAAAAAVAEAEAAARAKAEATRRAEAEAAAAEAAATKAAAAEAAAAEAAARVADAQREAARAAEREVEAARVAQTASGALEETEESQGGSSETETETETNGAAHRSPGAVAPVTLPARQEIDWSKLKYSRNSIQLKLKTIKPTAPAIGSSGTGGGRPASPPRRNRSTNGRDEGHAPPSTGGRNSTESRGRTDRWPSAGASGRSKSTERATSKPRARAPLTQHQQRPSQRQGGPLGAVSPPVEHDMVSEAPSRTLVAGRLGSDGFLHLNISGPVAARTPVPDPRSTLSAPCAVRRILREFQYLHRHPLANVRCCVVDSPEISRERQLDVLMTWHINVAPSDGPLAGMLVHVEMLFPPTYPFAPPLLRTFYPLPHHAMVISSSGVPNTLCLAYTHVRLTGLPSTSSRFLSADSLSSLSSRLCAAGSPEWTPSYGGAGDEHPTNSCTMLAAEGEATGLNGVELAAAVGHSPRKVPSAALHTVKRTASAVTIVSPTTAIAGGGSPCQAMCDADRGWRPHYGAYTILSQLQTFFNAEAFESARDAIGEALFEQSIAQARAMCSQHACAACGHCPAAPQPFVEVYNGPFFTLTDAPEESQAPETVQDPQNSRFYCPPQSGFTRGPGWRHWGHLLGSGRHVFSMETTQGVRPGIRLAAVPVRSIGAAGGASAMWPPVGASGAGAPEPALSLTINTATGEVLESRAAHAVSSRLAPLISPTAPELQKELAVHLEVGHVKDGSDGAEAPAKGISVTWVAAPDSSSSPSALSRRTELCLSLPTSLPLLPPLKKSKRSAKRAKINDGVLLEHNAGDTPLTLPTAAVPCAAQVEPALAESEQVEPALAEPGQVEPALAESEPEPEEVPVLWQVSLHLPDPDTSVHCVFHVGDPMTGVAGESGDSAGAVEGVAAEWSVADEVAGSSTCRVTPSRVSRYCMATLDSEATVDGRAGVKRVADAAFNCLGLLCRAVYAHDLRALGQLPPSPVLEDVHRRGGRGSSGASLDFTPISASVVPATFISLDAFDQLQPQVLHARVGEGIPSLLPPSSPSPVPPVSKGQRGRGRPAGTSAAAPAATPHNAPLPRCWCASEQRMWFIPVITPALLEAHADVSQVLDILRHACIHMHRNPSASTAYAPPFRPAYAVRVLSLMLHSVIRALSQLVVASPRLPPPCAPHPHTLPQGPQLLSPAEMAATTSSVGSSGPSTHSSRGRRGLSPSVRGLMDLETEPNALYSSTILDADLLAHAQDFLMDVVDVPVPSASSSPEVLAAELLLPAGEGEVAGHGGAATKMLAPEASHSTLPSNSLSPKRQSPGVMAGVEMRQGTGAAHAAVTPMMRAVMDTYLLLLLTTAELCARDMAVQREFQRVADDVAMAAGRPSHIDPSRPPVADRATRRLLHALLDIFPEVLSVVGAAPPSQPIPNRLEQFNAFTAQNDVTLLRWALSRHHPPNGHTLRTGPKPAPLPSSA